MVQAPTNVDTLFEQALSLEPEDRVELAHLLIDSLVDAEDEKDPGYDEYWEAEIRRQNAEIDAGTADLVPLEDVRAEMFGPRR